MRKEKQESEVGCPLQLSQCFTTSCRYFLKYEGRCAYEQIKQLERKQRQKAEESQSPARRVSDRREYVRMKG